MFAAMQATAFESDAPLGARRAVIRRDAVDGSPELVELAWGLAAADPSELPFRFVRSEGRTFPTHRCLVPASEFHVSYRDRRYRFTLEDGNWFYLAGIWRPSVRGFPEAYAILTVAANPEVARYQDRQGALIRRNRHLHWLDGTLPEDEILQTPPPRTFLCEEIDPKPELTCLGL
ncbi:SOS response-associated peptidase family protein [Sphingomonas sp. BIUV-7]|uniref:SOS response-associated peptidase family protein n=1 Tax=Sphingomonas natans TaxID=3063330 RepID=A0ABT8YAM1_9SPHN|nr:SOS response-associated peptidase family protein [Sphingomonas sp. BIUV-7]MDO6415360.1 SOS response-associated peptidase family protein [Sphingomonas sp. BIUV-7]